MSDPLINLMVAIAVLVVFAAVVWPNHGAVAQIRRIRQTSRRRVAEDALKHILKSEIEHRSVTINSLAGAVGVSTDRIVQLLEDIAHLELITLQDVVPKLTPAGRDEAIHLVRAHRLWERYLADRTGLHETEWHDQADRVEHRLSPEQVRTLASELGHPVYDPHGDPIPDEENGLRPLDGKPLTSLDVEQTGRIVHLEDEPGIVYAQLVAEGLTPGMAVNVVEKSPSRIRFWADGVEIALAPIVANNVTVKETGPIVDARQPATATLADVAPGGKARVAAISRACRGQERRRLLDLGVVPGTVVSVLRVAPGGDPVAYDIRGASIALRNQQARLINVVPVDGDI